MKILLRFFVGLLCGLWFASPSANAESLAGLPPAYIGTAEHDPLRDDGAKYAELLSAAGVPVDISNEPTMVHGFVSLARASPVATEATNSGLAAVKAALHP